MGKTLTLSAESKLDFSTSFRVNQDGIFCQDRPVPSYLANFDDTDKKYATGAFQYSDDTTSQLLSDLLASPTMEQQVISGSKKRSAAGFANASPPKPPKSKPYIPDMVEQSNGQVSSDAISRANMSAFAANRLQAQAHELFLSRRKPSTSVQPKTTSRQRKGTVRYPRPSRGSNGAEPHQPGYKPVWEILDRSGLPQVKICQPPITTYPTELSQAQASTIQGSLTIDLQEDRRKFNRKFESILALTDAVRLEPKHVMDIRRSKTAREPKRADSTKQKGVFKKMTNALTDRLHLMHKATPVEAHEADEGRGGFYDYEANQFMKDIEADIPTQKRQLPSRLTEIYERGSYDNVAKSVSDDHFDAISEVQSFEPSPSKEADDPFADPDSSRLTTDFVSRLKATTPLKSGGDATPVTPSASFSTMDGLLRSSINSLLPYPPVGASTPRLRAHHRHYKDLEGSEVKHAKSANCLSHIVTRDESDMSCDEAPKAESDDDMPNMGRNLRPDHGCTDRPVLNAPNRKKHPSPNKLDLELLETRLREHWPETLSQATEQAKKHPSPLKVDMQALGEQFRQTYPDLLAGKTPDQVATKKRPGAGKSGDVCLVENADEDEKDELALSFVTSTPEKRGRSRHRKVSSASLSSQEAMLNKKNKRRTVTMSEFLGGVDATDELACAAYRLA
ncbi:hypothetical protein GE09DRAFT_1260318 [Coniochaeta sp. 2T2.1]|nr:hypothetical protein GE09DRAFT_1260318 [Coniochaeta sp. 2T2.1]